jgi:hypothetical protein
MKILGGVPKQIIRAFEASYHLLKLIIGTLSLLMILSMLGI